MAGIDAKLVSELRQRTGLPLMKCKQSLVDAGGDIEKAIENLRKEGMKTVGKLADRAMKEGLVFTHETAEGAAAVAVLCETDFVARSVDFVAFGKDLVARVWAEAPEDQGEGSAISGLKLSDGRTVAARLEDLVGNKIRENMKVGAFARFRPKEGYVGVYVHHNTKIASVVELAGQGLAAKEPVKTLANDLGMQIAFHAQLEGLTKDDLDPEWVAKEREIFVAQSADMPEDKRAKIAEGKLAKRLKEVVLLDQPFLRDDKQSVQQHVAAVAKEVGTPVRIARFARIAAGA
jgi:elongation factor Ts